MYRRFNSENDREAREESLRARKAAAEQSHFDRLQHHPLPGRSALDQKRREAAEAANSPEDPFALRVKPASHPAWIEI